MFGWQTAFKMSVPDCINGEISLSSFSNYFMKTILYETTKSREHLGSDLTTPVEANP